MRVVTSLASFPVITVTVVTVTVIIIILYRIQNTDSTSGLFLILHLVSPSLSQSYHFNRMM